MDRKDKVPALKGLRVWGWGREGEVEKVKKCSALFGMSPDKNEPWFWWQKVEKRENPGGK